MQGTAVSATVFELPLTSDPTPELRFASDPVFWRQSGSKVMVETEDR